MNDRRTLPEQQGSDGERLQPQVNEGPGEQFALPRAVSRLFDGATFPWAIAGGWALDLFLDVETRPHDDIEVALWRRDQQQARDHLEARRYVLTVVRDGREEPWRTGELLALPLHEVHARAGRPDAVDVELLLNEAQSGEFRFRRESSIRRALDVAVVPSPRGMPVLAPEIVLLYKSGGLRRPKDDADFHRCIPALGAERRAWLYDAVSRCDPDHPWLESMRGLP